jgi:hypothetical protein
LCWLDDSVAICKVGQLFKYHWLEFISGAINWAVIDGFEYLKLGE